MGAAVENILFSRLPKRDTPSGTAEASGAAALGKRASEKNFMRVLVSADGFV